MSEWVIPFEEYLERAQLNLKTFQDYLVLPSRVRGIKKIIPLRTLRQIDCVHNMKTKFLLKIIQQIKTLDGLKSPFSHSHIDIVKIDPNQVKVGQKFVYREKYINMIESLPRVFHEFAIGSGFSDLGAFIIFGKDKSGHQCLSYYIPPMVEKHGNELLTMDGFHRNFLTRQMGSTINTVIIKNVNIPFPCSPHHWNETQVISIEKRPENIKERYFDLNKNLFRDLKYLGIDG